MAATKEDVERIDELITELGNKVDKNLETSVQGQAYVSSRVKLHDEQIPELGQKLDAIDEKIDQQRGFNNLTIQDHKKDVSKAINKMKEDIEELSKRAQGTTETQATSGSVSEGVGELPSEHQGQEVKELQARLGDLQTDLQDIRSECNDRMLQAQEYRKNTEDMEKEQEVRLARMREELKEEHEEKDRQTWEAFQRKLNQATELMQGKLNEQKDESRKRTDRNDNDKLLCLKETTIPKLDEHFSQADFVNWVEDLYMHLEVAGWA